jgi:hypothetical protein
MSAEQLQSCAEAVARTSDEKAWAVFFIAAGIFLVVVIGFACAKELVSIIRQAKR